MSSENGSAADPTARVGHAEALLRSLAGIILARIITDRDGRVREIRVLGDPDLEPGLIARNVQSALLARFGTFVEIDRIRVTLAPGEERSEDAARHDAPPSHATPGPAAAPAPSTNGTRPAPAAATLDSLEIERSHAQLVRCRLTLTWNGHRLGGAAELVDGPDAPLEAAARAAIAALNGAGSAARIELDGIHTSVISGRAYATAAVRALHGRTVQFLAGAAPIEHSPEDAAAVAAIRAAAPWLAARLPADGAATSA